MLIEWLFRPLSPVGLSDGVVVITSVCLAGDPYFSMVCYIVLFWFTIY